MGAWADLTLPVEKLTAISHSDFKGLPGTTVPAASEYLIRAKGKLQSLLRRHLAVFIVQTGDVLFFDAVAAAASTLDPLQDTLACGYAWAYYWDKMINVDDQWAIRARECLREMEAGAEALASVLPGILGETDTAVGTPAVSAVVTGIGRLGNTTIPNLPR